MALWLALVVIVNLMLGGTVRLILFCAIPVGVVTWKVGMTSGFVFAAFAAYAAVLGGAIPSHPELQEDPIGEVIWVYLKLTAVALGVRAAKRCESLTWYWVDHYLADHESNGSVLQLQLKWVGSRGCVPLQIIWSQLQITVCDVPACHLHSRYTRTLADLPWGGYGVRLQLHVRKFFCAVAGYRRRIFTERLYSMAPWARRLVNYEQIWALHCQGWSNRAIAKQVGIAA